MTEALTAKYRPKVWEDVLGQDEVVRSLAAHVEARDAHCILLIGPSGCGKTTLARISANLLGATPSTLIDVDAATYTGIEEMRKLTSMLGYVPIGGESLVFVVDECHRLSANAWDSLLKSTEEPPDWAYWFFCTTNPTKVPNTIVTRSLRLNVQPVKWQSLLQDLLVPIAEIEGMEVAKGILGVCARAANGSPRQALANLAACSQAQDENEAAILLRQLTEDTGGAVIKLVKMLLDGAPWDRFLMVLNELGDENPESVRHIVLDYVTKVLLDAKTEKRAQHCCAILDSFSMPFNSSEGISPLVLAVGRMVLLHH